MDSAVDPSDGLEPLIRVNEMVEWAISKGAFLHHEVEVFHSEEYGIALRVKHHKSPSPNENIVSSRRLLATTRVVSCPFQLSLSYLNALNKFHDLRSHSNLFPPEMFQLEPHIIGNFFLMQQYLTVETSFWSTYIKSLPQPDEPEKLKTPLYYSKEELKWLQGTNLESATRDRKNTWMLEWRHGVGILDKSHHLRDLHGLWTFDLYKWAATIFSSRSFVSRLIPQEVFGKLTPIELPSGSRTTYAASQSVPLVAPLPNNLSDMTADDMPSHPVLFPLVDIANHSPDSKVTWFSNAKGPCKDLSIIVDSEMLEGDQIFNNYAPKSNTELLLGYGFVIPGNDEVTISIKVLEQRLMEIRERQYCYHDSISASSKRNTYRVRRESYPSASRMYSLPEFSVFEAGCVDTLALYLANRHERMFLSRNPQYCPERDSSISFNDPMVRNILQIMSVLQEKLQAMLDEIIQTGKNLGRPQTQAEMMAMLYRQGQMATLTEAITPLQVRLDSLVSKHNLCGHMKNANDVGLVDETDISVELITLECAFFWLKSTDEVLWDEVEPLIHQELELESHLLAKNWSEVIEGDWDFTLWCFWIFLVISLSRTKEGYHSAADHLQNWIDYMVTIYDLEGRFSAQSFEYFQGDADEQKTLEIMVSGLKNQPGDSKKLLNFASTVAREESFVVDVKIIGPETSRLKQRVLCLSKKEHEESSLLYETVNDQVKLTTDDD